jgi:hypothetical protein
MILIALALAAAASTPATDNFGTPFQPWVPTDVRNFIIDAQACSHFSGEFGYDAERKAFLDRMIAETCTGLDKRKAALSRRYSRSARTKQLLSDVGD